MNDAVTTTKLAKTHEGKVHALRGVDLNMRSNQLFTLLGQNGAG